MIMPFMRANCSAVLKVWVAMVERHHRALRGCVISFVALWGVAPLVAQVTYSVFPAKQPDSNVAAVQPINYGTRSHVTVVVQDSTIDYLITR